MASNTHATFRGAGVNHAGSGDMNIGGDMYINTPTQKAADDCLRDLFLTDPFEDRRALQRKKGRRAENTCEWILETEPLITWLDSNTEPDAQSNASNVLWLYGNPGTGKSTMAIFLTEELSKIFASTSGKTLAYFFCDSSFDTRKNATAVIRGLLLQLVQQHRQLLDHLLPRYRERGSKLFESFDALWSVFENMTAQAAGHIFCIIDALDECDTESQMALLQQLEILQSSNVAPNLKILITSRPYPEIRDSLQHFAETADLATFTGSNEDISRCIDDKVATLQKRKMYAKQVVSQVKQILEAKAQGTFLWIGLACEELSNIPSKEAVKFLQKLPPNLHALYHSLLNAAIQQQQADQDTIKRILGFVAVAQRPLSVLELSEACELHLNIEDEETRIQFTREEIACCRLIIIIQQDKVCLLHQSVKDFLIGTGGNYFLDELQTHADTAFRCIEQLIKRFDSEKSNKVLSIPFVRYSVEFWPDHARMAQTRFEVRDCHQKLFAIKSPLRERWLKLSPYSWEATLSNFSILHVAARWGIPALVECIRPTKFSSDLRSTEINAINLDCITSAGDTPLAEATYGGYIAVVEELLNKGANLTTKALINAAQNNKNGEIMKLLFDRRGDQVIITEPVVKAAASNLWSGEAIMNLLFDRRGDQIIITEEIVAIAAVYQCDEAVLNLLLNRRGDRIITEQVIAAAAGNWHSEAVMNLLLNRRGDQVIITEAVVAAAAENPHGEAVMNLLFDRRGDQVIITEAVVLAAAENENGEAIMNLLFDQRGNQIIITEAIIAAAAKNRNGSAIMNLLFDRRGDQIIITEAVVAAVAGNTWSGEAIMSLLFDRRGDQIIITEAVVAAVAGNIWSGEAMMNLLFDRRGDQVIITETVLLAAAGNRRGVSVINLLFDRWGDQVIITEAVVLAAARHWLGEAIINLLFDRRGDQVIITEAVVAAAAGNPHGEAVMNLLFDRRGNQIIITEAIIAAAAKNKNGKAIMNLLLDRRGDVSSLM